LFHFTFGVVDSLVWVIVLFRLFSKPFAQPYKNQRKMPNKLSTLQIEGKDAAFDSNKQKFESTKLQKI
jgi:hypothetical protein